MKFQPLSSVRFAGFSLFACLAFAVACSKSNTPPPQPKAALPAAQTAAPGHTPGSVKPAPPKPGVETAAEKVRKVPELVEVSGRYDSIPKPRSTRNDDGSTWVASWGTLVRPEVSAELEDDIDIPKAAKFTFISPELKGCKSAKILIPEIKRKGESSIQINLEDPQGSSACLEFATAIETGGLVMEFTDVPLVREALHGQQGKIKKLTLKVALP